MQFLIMNLVLKQRRVLKFVFNFQCLSEEFDYLKLQDKNSSPLAWGEFWILAHGF